jgi:hypothetical protein
VIGNDKKLRIFGLEKALPLNSVPNEDQLDSEDLDSMEGEITHDIDLRAFILLYVELETGNPKFIKRHKDNGRLRNTPKHCLVQRPGELCEQMFFLTFMAAFRNSFPTYETLAKAKADPKNVVMNLLTMFTDTKSKKFSDFVSEFWEARTMDELMQSSE